METTAQLATDNRRQTFFQGQSALSGAQRLTKRLIDLMIGGPALVVLSPFMLLIATLVRLDSPGPSVFRQTRVGEGGRPFAMYKFRSMRWSAGQPATALTDGHKRQDDPRVTSVGRLLRRFGLDELPQLWNVVRGDMSLVGPRPELPNIVAGYADWQYGRLAAPQGITGWWQVNRDADVPMSQATELDLYYLRHWSLWLDLQIMAMTLPAILRGRGAF